MAFGVEDFHDLIELLAQHPEWRAELRRHVLADELLEMPALMRQLMESHARAEARFGQAEIRLERLEASVQALVEAQAAANERLDRLEASVQALGEAQAGANERLDRLEATVQALAEAQTQAEARLAHVEDRLERVEQRLEHVETRLERVEIRLEHVEGRLERVEGRLDTVDQRLGQMNDRLGEMDGDLMELHYAQRGLSYLSPIARRLRIVDPSRLAELLDDAADEGVLTERERAAVLLADVVFSGRRREDGQEIYILAEVSSGVGPHDVERAAERAALLEKLGRPVMPIVAGRRILDDAATLAAKLGVWTAEGGRVTGPQSA